MVVHILFTHPKLMVSIVGLQKLKRTRLLYNSSVCVCHSSKIDGFNCGTAKIEENQASL